MAPIRNGVIRDIRNEVFHKVTVLPLSYFNEEKKGDIMTRLTSDVQEIEWSILNVLEATFREPVAFAPAVTSEWLSSIVANSGSLLSSRPPELFRLTTTESGR